MKVKLLAGVAMAGLFTAGVANAEPNGWYGAIDAGYHTIDDLELVSQTTGPQWDFALDNDWAACARLGYRFDQNWRVELEGGAWSPAFSWPCRCGGRYALPEADARGEVVLPCASCSLHVGARCPAAGARLADYGLEAPPE